MERGSRLKNKKIFDNFDTPQDNETKKPSPRNLMLEIFPCILASLVCAPWTSHCKLLGDWTATLSRGIFQMRLDNIRHGLNKHRVSVQ